jgi:hypothetical protein
MDIALIVLGDKLKPEQTSPKRQKQGFHPLPNHFNAYIKIAYYIKTIQGTFIICLTRIIVHDVIIIHLRRWNVQSLRKSTCPYM